MPFSTARRDFHKIDQENSPTCSGVDRPAAKSGETPACPGWTGHHGSDPFQPSIAVIPVACLIAPVTGFTFLRTYSAFFLSHRSSKGFARLSERSSRPSAASAAAAASGETSRVAFYSRRPHAPVCVCVEGGGRLHRDRWAWYHIHLSTPLWAEAYLIARSILCAFYMNICTISHQNLRN